MDFVESTSSDQTVINITSDLSRVTRTFKTKGKNVDDIVLLDGTEENQVSFVPNIPFFVQNETTVEYKNEMMENVQRVSLTDNSIVVYRGNDFRVLPMAEAKVDNSVVARLYAPFIGDIVGVTETTNKISAHVNTAVHLKEDFASVIASAIVRNDTGATMNNVTIYLTGVANSQPNYAYRSEMEYSSIKGQDQGQSGVASTVLKTSSLKPHSSRSIPLEKTRGNIETVYSVDLDENRWDSHGNTSNVEIKLDTEVLAGGIEVFNYQLMLLARGLLDKKYMKNTFVPVGQSSWVVYSIGRKEKRDAKNRLMSVVLDLRVQNTLKESIKFLVRKKSGGANFMSERAGYDSKQVTIGAEKTYSETFEFKIF